jgi:hypothetical protein
MTLKMRARHETTVRDLIQPDARVVCVEAFQPYIGTAVDKGRYYKLSDAVVQRYPANFCVVIPVSDVIGEVER